MPKSREAQWIVAGVILAGLLVASIAGVALRGRIVVAAGLDHPATAPTIAPSTFVEPDAASVPISEHLLPPAEVTGDGPAPGAEALGNRLRAIQTTALVTPDGKPASLAWEAIDVTSGTVVASRASDQPLIPASNTKTLTMVAVFSAFEGNERFATRVTSPEPGRIVLVGGGDALLASEPAAPDAYPQPASLRALATATAAALREKGTTTVTLGFDASYFEGPAWAPTWPANYRDQVTPISALWADEGRVGGVRQQDPALAAAKTFAAQLGELGITVQGDPTAGRGTGAELARVESLPLRVLAEQAMQRSNNSFTEVLGRQLARRMGRPASFEGAVAAIEERLRTLGIWDDDARLFDASGLSRSNRATAHMLATAYLHIVRDPDLTRILDGLPVAGVTGTLRERFTTDASRPARGVARAKTGTLSLVSTLAGHTTTKDGALVVYAIMANGQVDGYAAKVWEDDIVGTLTGCGC